jgi:hypothetical protein
MERMISSHSLRKVFCIILLSLDLESMTINELEFSIASDAKELYQTSDMSGLKARDINCIKLILASALYPNFAIADEANYSKRLSEQGTYAAAFNL